MQIRNLVLGIVMIFALTVGACAPKAAEQTPAQTPPPTVIEWRFAHTTSVANTAWEIVGTKEFGERMGKATGGRLKVTHLVSIINGIDGMTAIRDGRIEACDLIYSYADATYPLWCVSGLDGIVRDKNDLLKIYDKVIWPIVEKDAKETYGAKLVAQGYWPGTEFYSSTPMPTTKDFVGKKFRVDSKYRAITLQALGGAAVTMPFGELYAAIQRGMVDGFLTATVPFLGSKMYEVAKYINQWPTGENAWGIFISEKAWTALPSDVRSQVEAELAKMRNELLLRDQKDAQNALATLKKDYGCIVIVPTPEEQAKYLEVAKKTTWEEWYKITGNEGRKTMDDVRKVLGY